jgi:hypothetical protein
LGQEKTGSKSRQVPRNAASSRPDSVERAQVLVEPGAAGTRVDAVVADLPGDSAPAVLEDPSAGPGSLHADGSSDPCGRCGRWGKGVVLGAAIIHPISGATRKMTFDAS